MRRLVVLTLLAACAATEVAETPTEVALRARHAEALGDWRHAAELWLSLHDGDDPAAARGLARALDAWGDAMGALRVLDSVEVVSPKLLLDRGALQAHLGQVELAVESLREACALDTGSVEARARLGELLLRLDRPQEALVVLREAIALEPGDASLRRQFKVAARRTGAREEERGAYLALADLSALGFEEALAFAQLSLEDPAHQAAAAEWLAAGLERDPSRGDGWRVMALLLERLGDEEGRLAALRATLEMDPADRATLLTLAGARAARGEWEAVEVLADHARTLGDAELVERIEALLAGREEEREEDGETD